MSIPAINIIAALKDKELFAPWLKDKATWQAWLSFLAALFGLPMDDAQTKIFKQCTGREQPPGHAFNEAWLVCGRRAGKSFTLALIAVYLAAFKNYAQYLAPGERATILILAQDRKVARVIFRYVGALLKQVPLLSPLIERETAESFDLTNRCTIEVGTASYRSTRGYTFAALLCDEIAFWRSDDSANPDAEVLNAVRPGMATIPGAMLLCASSPYARRGALYDAFTRHFAKADAPALVWKAPTRTMNPTVPQKLIDEELDKDVAAASAEYLAEFRSDIESFISPEAVKACIAGGMRERQPDYKNRYVAFVDPSGGSSDSFTMAIAHLEGQKPNRTAILDLVREVAPPFSPEGTVEQFCETLRSYRVTKVVGDRYGGEFPRELFRQRGISYELAEKTRSELYLELLPLVNSQAVSLLDHDKLFRQLITLERRTARTGKDSIDHMPGSHDDIANAVAGALVRAWALPSHSTTADGFRRRPKVILGHQAARRPSRGRPPAPLNYNPSGSPHQLD